MYQNDINYSDHSGEVYSFDVFDTVITRCALSPFGIFAYMQKQLSLQQSSAYPIELIRNYQQIRIDAENRARKNGGGKS